MSRALLLKELRESAVIALGALIAFLGLTGMAMGLPILPFLSGPWREIPFVGPSFLSHFMVTAVVLAATLGFHQSIRDSAGSVYLFVLHRPLSRRQIFVNKLVVGLLVYFVISAIPILLLSIWAATPGTHASPFEWSMTWYTWRVWLVISLVYFGAFLSGIRQASWFGTRLVPLATAGLLATLGGSVPMVGLSLSLWLLVFVVFAWLIVIQGNSRDFA